MIRKIFPEFVSIVFAVTLALLVNEWRQNRRDDKLVERILITLTDEVKLNLQQAEKALEYRKQLLKNIASGRHIVNQIPLAALNFDPSDNAQVAAGIRSALLADGNYESEVEVIESGDRRYLRLGSRVGRLQVERDTLFLYGDFSIRLKSASLQTHTWEMASATGALVNMDYDIIRKMSQIQVLSADYRATSEKALNLLYTGEGDPVSVMQDMRWLEQALVEHNRLLLKLLED